MRPQGSASRKKAASSGVSCGPEHPAMKARTMPWRSRGTEGVKRARAVVHREVSNLPPSLRAKRSNPVGWHDERRSQHPAPGSPRRYAPRDDGVRVPSPLAGEGGRPKAGRMRGCRGESILPAAPAPPHPALRATFSLEGRRERPALSSRKRGAPQRRAPFLIEVNVRLSSSRRSTGRRSPAAWCRGRWRLRGRGRRRGCGRWTCRSRPPCGWTA